MQVKGTVALVGALCIGCTSAGAELRPDIMLHGSYRLKTGECPREGYDYLIHIKERAMILPDYGCFQVNWNLISKKDGVEEYAGQAHCHDWNSDPKHADRAFKATVRRSGFTLIWSDGKKSGDFVRCK